MVKSRVRMRFGGTRKLRAAIRRGPRVERTRWVLPRCARFPGFQFCVCVCVSLSFVWFGSFVSFFVSFFVFLF